MKKIYLFLFFILCMTNQALLIGSTLVYVMPDQYAYVAGKNTAESDYNNWGGKDKWDDIVLWGRCPDSYIGYQYKWIYGDGNETGWTNINAFDPVNPFNSSNLYLKSDIHQYDVKSSEIIQFYKTKLLIKNGGVIISTTTLNVKAVDIRKITLSNDYSNPEESKRLIVESIAKGRGLTWLYLKQNKIEGSWVGPLVIGVEDNTGPITSFALLAFLNFGHSIYDPNGVKDIFVDCVNKGINYLIKNAKILSVIDVGPGHDHSNVSLGCPFVNCTWGSDINGNGKMISLDTNPTDNDNYRHGIAMLALGASYNAQRAVSTVNVGNPPVSMYYIDVLQDAVDYAAWTQIDITTVTIPQGWRYGQNPVSFDLSVHQWPVLGLTAIEEVWGIKAPDFVKTRLLETVIRMVQYQSIGDTKDGGAFYDRYHPPVTSYNTEAEHTNQVYNLYSWLVGTSALLQTCYYISIDTSTIAVCDCGSPDCDSGNNGKDLKIDNTNLENSCRRVKGAIDFMSRNWEAPPLPNSDSLPGNSFYTMYSVMKAFRLYNYAKNGINQGLLNNGGNFPLTAGAINFSWQEIYSDYLLTNMNSDYSWDDCYGGPNSNLGTAWALLILSDTIYLPSAIKTELMEPKMQRASIK